MPAVHHFLCVFILIESSTVVQTVTSSQLFVGHGSCRWFSNKISQLRRTYYSAGTFAWTQESNISRYNIEFIELGVIGRGEFGRVTRCVNKLDGCVYALKRSLRPVAGSAAERAALTEVYAHAALGKHPHVVRYYSAWAEDDHMIIQNEYCDGGSLQQKMENGPLSEPELLLLLAHIADGLAYIHSLQLVHMDVKPGNIFICSGEGQPSHDSDDGYDDEEVLYHHKYKIGDLGHVTCVSSPSVEEGDCRYLPKEVLQEDLTQLTKADIFAFGLTLFEAGGGGALPKNGQQWHDYRDGKLPELPNLSREYYSAWAEDDHMIIQNEYCDGGSLQQKMENGPLSEPELLLLLAHIADGLAYIHSLQLVHMDVKPGNIFICSGEGQPSHDSDDGYDDEEVLYHHKYKIGDLGHVTCVSSPSVEEGDCRYLPKEVLQEDLTQLTKADIFAFELPNLSREFNQLLRKMVDPDPSVRPSAARLRRHPLLHPAGNKTKTQLRRELAAAKMKNELLARKLQEAARELAAANMKNELLARKLQEAARELAAAKMKNELLARKLQEAAR
ncbi:hypothetical protein B5X24_HaOG213931 [Helicoverpa armigera]|uniref:Wee1-like protein kinase n=1 Tax=Helicoverpa armigera TaxID=29058 RepID=A0A2W1B684_HELAM|nr:hypothetical protein B5X24_HaOG213931 [Helicoverpa armigera]